MSDTLAPLVRRYLAERVAQGYYTGASPRSVRPRLMSFSAHFGRRPLSQYTERAILTWIAALELPSPNSTNAYLASVKVFSRWLVKQRIIPADPSADIARVRVPRMAPRHLSRTQVKAALDACVDNRDRTMIWLMVGLGLRRGEVARATWEDLDITNGTLLVHGKAGNERHVGVPPEVERVLARCDAPHKGPIIVSSIGGPLSPNTVGDRVAAVLKAAGVKQTAYDGVSGHAFRHTFAGDVLDLNIDIRDLQEQLGHADLTSTSIYLKRHRSTRLRAAMAGRDYEADDTSQQQAAA